jgi:hypothetical protein
MTKEDLLVLQSWAEGLCGANARLAKRAWLILENHRRKSPQLISGAWGDSKEAQKWIKSFHSMGLLGLLDAPRIGRKRVHTLLETKLEHLRDRDQSTDKKEVFDKLTKKERESLWRLKRTKGMEFLRKREGLNLQVTTTPTLSDLAGLLITPTIQVISTFSNSKMHIDGLNGTWLHVDKRVKSKNGSVNIPHQNLLAALKIKITRSEASQVAFEKKTKLSIDKFIKRTVESIKNISSTYPKRLSVAVIVDINGGDNLVRFLNELRKSMLCVKDTSSESSKLKGLHIIPHSNNRAEKLQYLLAREFEHSNQDDLGELLDSISIRRQDPFCWIRELKSELIESENAWQLQSTRYLIKGKNTKNVLAELEPESEQDD